MRVLGFDTATTATTVAVHDTDTGATFERRDDPPVGARPRHTAQLLVLAAQALADADTDWTGVDRIAVGTGPGTFTGIRIGVASARALASARDTAIVGVSTLQALALGAVDAARERGREPLAVLDARRREVFVAGWSVAWAGDPDAPARRPARVLAPDELARRLGEGKGKGKGDADADADADADGEREGTRWLAVGDGAVASRSLLEGAGALVPDDGSPLHRVSAVAICRLGLQMAPLAPDQIHPEYMRLPDAELNRRAAAPPRGAER
jgi:tRNA threonylcarbamoyladenosine biosynthesis protein TsaB